MKTLLFAVMLFGGIVHAQSAKVVPLTPADAARVKVLYERAAVADKAVVDVQDEIRAKYIPTNASVTYVQPPSGWNNREFVFSDDFKFIVPKPVPYSSGSIFSSGGCLSYVSN